MPCYEIRTVSVSFQVGNVDLLRKAVAKDGWLISRDDPTGIGLVIKKGYKKITIDLLAVEVRSTDFNEKELSTISNSIKRAYSEQVIDEISKKQRWVKHQMGEGRYRLQKF